MYVCVCVHTCVRWLLSEKYNLFRVIRQTNVTESKLWPNDKPKKKSHAQTPY